MSQHLINTIILSIAGFTSVFILSMNKADTIKFQVKVVFTILGILLSTFLISLLWLVITKGWLHV